MTPADRLAEALQRINAIDGGEYPCAEIALAQEIAMEALAAYRAAPPVDIERCAREMADAWVAWKDAAGVRRSEVQIERWAAFESAANKYRAVLREIGMEVDDA